jgi:glycosyltransferase involved in cell wall biosynthesis
VRIVFVLGQADMSGGVRTVATYARLLSLRGHQVTIVSTPPAAPRLRSRVKSLLLGRGWPAAPAPGPSHADAAGVAHIRVERSRPIVDGDVPDADVVIATWWETAEWVAALSPRKGVKVHFVQGHEADLPGQPEERVAATWRLPFHRIACSRWIVETARDRFGVDELVIVPNGVDLGLFTSEPRERQGVPTVGLVYSGAWIKGCDVAFAAVERARSAVPGLRLVCFGAASPHADARPPAGTELIVRPEQAEIPGLYARCDAWLWPSRREGFGLPILEAMACRTPVIAAPAGAAPEILASGGGVLLPAADREAMAGAIHRIVTLRGPEWQRLSAEARAIAETYRWEDSAGRFEAALAAAVERADLPHPRRRRAPALPGQPPATR